MGLPGSQDDRPFEDAGFRVIVPELIGFVRSDKPADSEAYTYSQHVAVVTRLVAALDRAARRSLPRIGAGSSASGWSPR